MKIAFLVGEFPSLSETFIINQITGLLDRGHDVKIFAFRKRNESKVHPDVESYDLASICSYHNMPKSKVKRILGAIGLIVRNPKLLNTLNIIKYPKSILSLEPLYMASMLNSIETEFDIIYCHFGTMGNLGACIRSAGFIKGKLITTFHGNDISAYLQKHGKHAYDFLFREGDLFLPISDNWRNKLIELGCEHSKILVHRMGIDTTKFEFKPRELTNDGIVRCTTIARLVEKKGVEYGIRAIASILKDNPFLQYDIVGDGPLRKELQSIIDELGVGKHIRLLGWQQQNEVIRILKSTHIFLAPSVTAQDGDQEGIPVVLMEALSMGIPVISTLHSGIPELIRDEESGYLVPEKDVKALAEKIQKLAENNERWIDMGSEGRNFVEENYDVNILNEKLVSIFRNFAVDLGRMNG